MAAINSFLQLAVSPVTGHNPLLPTRNLFTKSKALVKCRRVITGCLNKNVEGKYARKPLNVVRGQGCNLYDSEGKEYLDLSSEIAVNVFRHGDEDWNTALFEKADLSMRKELANRLVKQTSFADRVFFSKFGAEDAIIFSHLFQKNLNREAPAKEIVVFGKKAGAASALPSGKHYFAPFVSLTRDAGFIFEEYGDIEAAKKVIQRGKTAAVFVEPIQSEGGTFTAVKEFLQFLRNTCDEAGALLIFDEDQCGLGRTGTLWAHEAFGVKPDIMTLGRSLASGEEIGVVLFNKPVASAGSKYTYTDERNTFPNHVYNVSLAVLDIISQPGFLSSVADKGEYFKKLLTTKLEKNPHVKEIRGVGLVLGIQFDVSASPLVDACREAGVLIVAPGKGNAVRLSPLLTITKEELERAANIISEAIPSLDGVGQK